MLVLILGLFMIINLFKKILFLTFYVICISSCNSFLKDKYHSARITDINNNLIGDKNFSAKKLTLNSNNVIYFDLDKYDIKLNFLNQLNKHAMFLKNHPYYKIIIEGHTDEQGTPEYNIALGERRANAVKIYLQKNGVSNNQIKTISYGKEKLSILSHNEYANAKNRRAIINY